MQKILKTYIKRLTNLTGHNKSLLLLHLPVSQFVDLNEFDFLNNKSSYTVIESLIAGKNSIPLFPLHDSRFEKLNKISTQLKKIQRTSNFIEEERGSLDLYIGYPFVRGKFIDDTLVRCPLLFFPVVLEIENNNWKLKWRADEEINVNKNFLLAYSYFNNIPISDEWLDADFDEFDKDPLIFKTQLYEWLKKSPVELNFNQDVLKENNLIPFDNFNRARFTESHKTGELKLFNEAVLGIFPQSGSYLTPDYTQLLEKNKYESIENFFSGKFISNTNKQSAKEENTFIPFSIDASQEKALKLIKEGESLVVQGPPGTGKSQLICNLIADYTARGKKVLLVCQKRAALDVVYKRLSQVGIQSFVALVHDFQHDRKKLYEQLANQIEKAEIYKTENQNLDSIYIDRDFDQQSRRIDKISAELNEFKVALFDESECGVSVKELYLTSQPDLPSISLKKDYKFFHFGVNIPDYVRTLKYLEQYFLKFNKDGYSWKNRVSFHNFNNADRQNIIDQINNIPLYVQNLQNKLIPFLGKNISFNKAEEMLEERKEWLEFLNNISNEAQWIIFRDFFLKKEKEFPEQTWFKETEKKVGKCFSEKGIIANINKTDLVNYSQLINEALRAKRNFLSWTIWKTFSGKKNQLKEILFQNHLVLSLDNLIVLNEKIQNSLALEEIVNQMTAVDEVVQPFDKDYLIRWFENHRQAGKAKKIIKKLNFFKPGLPLLNETYLNFQQKTHLLFSLLQEASAQRKHWNKFLPNSKINSILDGKANTGKWIETLKDDFDELVETDKLYHSMGAIEKEVFDKLWDKRQSDENLSISLTFENSIRLAWIYHIEEKYPILQAASGQKMGRIEDELQASVDQKTTLSKNILLMRLKENIYREVEFNRLHNQVTYRDLKHQVTKKRNIWPIRKLTAEFSDEIFRLVPCWMASPETVSAVFPLSKEDDEPIFDLVIFDEASQCFAENGLPAMYRARQIVITGDSKQLAPSDLYNIRFEEDNEETPDLELESLLDLSARYFPQVQLQGHYRSKTLDLIDFSNEHFYKNSLHLLPDRLTMNSYEPAIKYKKLDGIFENSQNEAEAHEVIKIISELLKDEPGKEIGIVTFNFKQQNLIQDLLEEWAINEKIILPESLFVKNIENVQGDERDIIVFSVAYAPDKTGKISLQFGTLNMQGGENRLNVAITRAKEKIIIVSSILPNQLQTDNTLNIGPKLLKKYLEYALMVSEGKYVPKTLINNALPSQTLLKSKLIILKEDLKNELPFADLTIKKDKNYEGLILTDDDLYYQTLSVKDAHVYTPFILNRKNWPFIRIYSRQYWKDQAKVREKLKY